MSKLKDRLNEKEFGNMEKTMYSNKILNLRNVRQDIEQWMKKYKKNLDKFVISRLSGEISELKKIETNLDNIYDSIKIKGW